MTDNRLTRVLGADSLRDTDPNRRYRSTSDVIGSVETSMAGNTVLIVGEQRIGERTWESGKAHVVLTPAETEALVAAIQASRATDRPTGEPNPMQDAYDAYFRAAEHLALVALHDVATQVREARPEATAMRIDWSDQGDYLEPSATAIVNGTEDDDWIDTDNASALDESNRSTWEAYAEPGERRDLDAHGYVFPLDRILTDLDPENPKPSAP